MKKKFIDTLPIIENVIDNIDLRKLIDSHFKNTRHTEAFICLVKNILIDHSSLYKIPEWVEGFEDSLVSAPGLPPVTDDLLGRMLDKGFKIDRATLITQLTLAIINKYNLDCSQVHNDSTSLNTYGAHKSQNPKGVQLCRGHSKDHRSDLKQIIYNTSILRDGAVPIHFKLHNGNVTDDTIHIQTWKSLCQILGKKNFLYVADSKLCTKNNMHTIDSEGGRFVSIVPKTRKECKDFYEQCRASLPRWEILIRRQIPNTNRFDVVRVCPALTQLHEGYRIHWYKSSVKMERDEFSRQHRIKRALMMLDKLSHKKKRGPKKSASLVKAAEEILARYNVGDLIKIAVHTKTIQVFKKVGRGKPTSDDYFKRILKDVHHLVFEVDYEEIGRHKAVDGIFPLVSNTELDSKDVYLAYKYQPNIERRFSILKSNFKAAPFFLKNNFRIEAMMLAAHVANTISAIIQRQLRISMRNNKIKEISILPEGRATSSPTWDCIRHVFSNYSRYYIINKGVTIKIMADGLTPIQNQVLTLLDVPKSLYAGDAII